MVQKAEVQAIEGDVAVLAKAIISHADIYILLWYICATLQGKR